MSCCQWDVISGVSNWLEGSCCDSGRTPRRTVVAARTPLQAGWTTVAVLCSQNSHAVLPTIVACRECRVRVPPAAIADCYCECVYVATFTRYAPRFGFMPLLDIYPKTAIFIYVTFRPYSSACLFTIIKRHDVKVSIAACLKGTSTSYCIYIKCLVSCIVWYASLFFRLLYLLLIMRAFPALIAFYFQASNVILLLFLSFCMLNS